MSFKTLYGFRSTLEVGINGIDGELIMADVPAYVIPEFFFGDWSSVQLWDGLYGTELMKISAMVRVDNQIRMTVSVRGFENTTARNFPIGAEVRFVFTDEGIFEIGETGGVVTPGFNAVGDPVQAGTGITVDNPTQSEYVVNITDTLAGVVNLTDGAIVNAQGQFTTIPAGWPNLTGTGQVDSVVGGNAITVDAADPANPIVHQEDLNAASPLLNNINQTTVDTYGRVTALPNNGWMPAALTPGNYDNATVIVDAEGSISAVSAGAASADPFTLAAISPLTIVNTGGNAHEVSHDRSFGMGTGDQAFSGITFTEWGHIKSFATGWITGVNGVTVSADTGAAVELSGVQATTLALGVVQLATQVNVDDGDANLVVDAALLKANLTGGQAKSFGFMTALQAANATVDDGGGTFTITTFPVDPTLLADEVLVVTADSAGALDDTGEPADVTIKFNGEAIGGGRGGTAVGLKNIIAAGLPITGPLIVELTIPAGSAGTEVSLVTLAKRLPNISYYIYRGNF